jgi:hypothetical protein|tara:strand:+ start:826 stop:1146 length:321 start_codon:yes stop_codon:yes gene_type:complete
MKYPDIIGSSDKKFRNYSYGKRPGKKLVKYSPTKAKLSKFRASMKNMKLSKGLYKGVKFGAKVATSPISLGLAGGALAVSAIKKGLNEKPSKRLGRSYDRKGISLL